MHQSPASSDISVAVRVHLHVDYVGLIGTLDNRLQYLDQHIPSEQSQNPPADYKMLYEFVRGVII